MGKDDPLKDEQKFGLLVATGKLLDQWAEIYGLLPRQARESDSDLRKRIIHRATCVDPKVFPPRHPTSHGS
jgi:hypothetical protein